MGLFNRLLGLQPRPPGVVLALGGGGARSLAHVGVLEVIEEADVRVAGIAGTSAGAVVGAMWLTLGNAAAVAERWREFLAEGIAPSLPDIRLTMSVTSRDNPILHFARRVRQGAVVALALDRTSLVTHDALENAIGFLFPDVPIESLRMPFAAVATDFDTGDPVALTRGSLRLAVAASCAIPAVVPPYTIGARNLIDGGTVADVPVEQAAGLARRPVVAVEVGEAWGEADPDTITLPRAMLRGANMTHRALREAQLRAAALVIRPDVGSAHWSEFERFEEARAAGHAAAQRGVRRMQALAVRRRAAGSEPEAA